MKMHHVFGSIATLAVLSATPLAAQDLEAAEAAVAEQATDAVTTAVPEVPIATVIIPKAEMPAAEVSKPCELHVWPTENYLGVKMGLLSGFGIVGALADQAAHKKGVTTVKDLMREYLGPEIQLNELEKLDYMTQLGLSADEYEVILQAPTPWNEDLKDNPELKAEVKAINKKIKRGERITDSTNPCYAELITTHIFYHKAMMYGSNLFTGWVFRKYDGDTVVIEGKGQVKNPLENFPPKEEAMVDAAKVELRDAYAKDFTEWIEKKSGV